MRYTLVIEEPIGSIGSVMVRKAPNGRWMADVICRIDPDEDRAVHRTVSSESAQGALDAVQRWLAESGCTSRILCD